MFTACIARHSPALAVAGRFVCLAALLFFSLTAWAEKTDIVYLKNGDRVTGEVKNLDRGMLEFSTDHMGTVYIEWSDIREIASTTGQAVELTNGERFYGPLDKPKNEEMMLVNTAQGPVAVSADDVIFMYPVKAGFWERLDLFASLGFAWDKGSSVGKYNVGLDAEYRDPRFVTSASFNSEVTTQEGRDDTSRVVFFANHLVFRQNKRYIAYYGDAESNDELGIDLRVLLGIGYGAMPVRTQSSRFAIGAGLAVNQEIPVDGESETNLEAVGTIGYNYFRYSSPERSFDSLLRVFPSLTETGRWRAAFTTDFRLELVKDLFWMLDFYASYDSEPLSAQASRSDYGVNSSLAYKF
jgi:Protein of unknown function, DUF481